MATKRASSINLAHPDSEEVQRLLELNVDNSKYKQIMPRTVKDKLTFSA